MVSRREAVSACRRLTGKGGNGRRSDPCRRASALSATVISLGLGVWACFSAHLLSSRPSPETRSRPRPDDLLLPADRASSRQGSTTGAERASVQHRTPLRYRRLSLHAAETPVTPLSSPSPLANSSGSQRTVTLACILAHSRLYLSRDWTRALRCRFEPIGECWLDCHCFRQPITILRKRQDLRLQPQRDQVKDHPAFCH